MWWRKKKKKAIGLKYICPNCNTEEVIPYEALEYFDDTNPQQLLHGPHMFRCEKCDGIMQPEKYEARVMGFGLYEGLDYTIKHENKNKKL